MSVQATLNQALALTAGLMSMNPSLQLKALDRKALKAAETEIDRSQKLSKIALKNNNKPVYKEQQVRYKAARKVQAEIDPDKYGWDYVFSTNRPYKTEKAEGYATKSMMTSTEAKNNILQGLEDREEILKKKKSLRQTMKEQGYKNKEIKNAYDNGGNY